MNLTLPVILWSGLLAAGDDPSCMAQCDCACPDRQSVLEAQSTPATQQLRCAAVHRQPVDEQWTLLFNPLHDAGVAVVNREALQFWERFTTPSTRDSACTDVAEHAYVDQLQARGLLQATGETVTWRHSAPQTLSVWLHISNRCNLRCTYCYIHKSAATMDAATGHAAVDAVFATAERHGFRTVKLKFAGGEASLAMPRVFALHDYACTVAAATGIALESVLLTNGVALGRRAIDGLLTRNIRVSLSLDGVGPHHDAQRIFPDGHGSFACVANTIDRLQAHGIRPFVSLTVSARNVDGLEAAVRYLLERDLPFNLNFYRENACSGDTSDLRLQDAQMIAALKRAFAAIERQLPEQSLLGSLLDRVRFDQPHDHACSAGDAYVVVDPTGQVSACQMEIEQPVASIWGGDLLTQVRSRQAGVQNLSVDMRDGCQSCLWRYWCGGGCPALAFHSYGRYDTRSPYCAVYQAVFPDLLHLEGVRIVRAAQRLTLA